MRNEKVTAFSLHHKAYKDKRSLYYLFTKEFGIIHGVGKKGIPQFVPLDLFISGKRSLKTLQQVNISHIVSTLSGQQQYAGLYINEIVLKLLPNEDPLLQLFEKYALTIASLREPLAPEQLRLVLRLFEDALFAQIGYQIDLNQDCKGQEIDAKASYEYVIDEGWRIVERAFNIGCSESPLNISTLSIPATQDMRKTKNKTDTVSGSTVSGSNVSGSNVSGSNVSGSNVLGSTIISMQKGINSENLYVFSMLHRRLIDHLFDYKPLQSRLLWQQFIKYR